MSRSILNKIQIVLTVVVFLYIGLFAVNKIFADDIYQIGRNSYKEIARIDNRYILGQTSEKKYFLLDPSLWGRKMLELTELQDEVEVCDFDKKYICLTGISGVHAKNLIVIEKKTLRPIMLGNDIVAVSDVPKFEFYNCTKISECKIAGYYRDYEKDPLQDMISEVYFYANGKFNITK